MKYKKSLIKKVMKKDRRKIARIGTTIWCFLLMTVMFTMTVFGAGANTGTIDKFIDFVCEWLVKIGAVVMMVGGVMFALGWQREDADGKTRGLQTLMAGAMVAAIGASPSIFGL